MQSSIRSSTKLNLLLQRSYRYSYRQRCCQCCPMILCELIFPFLLMALLILTRYGTNAALKKINEGSSSRFYRPQCSQDANTTMISSKDLLSRCFPFPPRYEMKKSSLNASGKIHLIIQPVTNETNELLRYARTRLDAMNCTDVEIS